MTEAEKLVKESIKRLKDKENKAREADAVLKIAYYDFDSIDLIKRLEKYIVRTEKDIPYTLTNITQKIIDRKSMVYKNPAIRTAGEKGENDTYNKATKDKDSSIKIAERQTNLIGRIGYQISWNEQKDRFGYNILQYFIPLEIKDKEIISLVYPINNEMESIRKWAYWGPEYHLIVNNVGVPVKNQEDYGITDPKFENPYKTIPFIFPFKKEPIGGFWVEGAGDVILGNEQINVLLSTLNFIDRYASFKQPYLKGPGLKDQKIEFGYNKIVFLETSGDNSSELGVLDIVAPLQQKIDSIKFQVELLLHNNDLNVRWGGSGQATSGFQIIVENIDLLTLWEDMVPIWRKHEADIYDIEKIVYKVHKGSLPEEMYVDFAEVKFPVSKQEQRDQDTWKLEHKLTSRLEIAKRENPDKPEKELIKDLERFEDEAKPEEPKRIGLAETIKGL